MGGGAVRFGQPHGAVMPSDAIGRLESFWGTKEAAFDERSEAKADSPMVGNLFEMIPKSVHASRLKKNVPWRSLMYVIWLDEKV